MNRGIQHKITEGTPDTVCRQCSQHWHGVCRAFSVAHTDEELKHRDDGFGMECDSEKLKEIRKKQGVKYRT